MTSNYKKSIEAYIPNIKLEINYGQYFYEQNIEHFDTADCVDQEKDKNGICCDGTIDICGVCDGGITNYTDCNNYCDRICL